MKATTTTKTSYQIPIGPIHPALKEPVHFEFEIEGERIVDADVRLGHIHRSIEWAGMNRRNPIQILYLAERICGICSYCHPMAFALAVERAADIDVPERADYLRVIHAELERICSHVLWAGVAAHEIGFDSVLYLTWQIREKALDLTEYLTGNRVTKAITMIGGVRRDITPDMIPTVRKGLDYLKGYFEKLPGPPKTVNQAVDMLMSKMALKDKVVIANMTHGELVDLNTNLGAYVKNIFSLWSGNNELMESCRIVTKNQKLNEDGACGAIIERLWKKLRKTHKIRVVK